MKHNQPSIPSSFSQSDASGNDWRCELLLLADKREFTPSSWHITSLRMRPDILYRSEPAIRTRLWTVLRPMIEKEIRSHMVIILIIYVVLCLACLSDFTSFQRDTSGRTDAQYLSDSEDYRSYGSCGSEPIDKSILKNKQEKDEIWDLWWIG